jgi:hypothetical protein
MSTNTGRYQVVAHVFCVILLGLSIFLRLWHLGNIPGMDGDEADYGVRSLAIIHGRPIAWFTSNGNFLNMLFYGPCILLHRIFPPSFALIRSIAVACGLLALCANYTLCSRVFDRRSALASTVLLAVLPEDIAQSRYGWDPSQSLLADAFVVYLAMLIALDQERSRWWTAWAAVATLAALSVHPTNAFLIPYVILAVAGRWRSQIVRLYAVKRVTIGAIAVYTVTVLVVAGCVGAGVKFVKHCVVAASSSTSGAGAGFVVAVATLANYWSHPPPASVYLAALFGYARLFSGVTVYRFVAGSLMPGSMPPYQIWLWTAIPLLILAASFVYGIRVLGRRQNGGPADRLLFRGWIITTALFFPFGGFFGFTPGNERYALCLILPGTLCVCRFALAIADRYPSVRYPIGAIGACLGLFLLASFYVNYFQYIEKTGGTSDTTLHTLHTAAVEPKLAAYRLIESQAGAGVPIAILASVWGVDQPLLYLAAADHRARVFTPYELGRPEAASYLRRAIAAGQMWEVEFEGSQAWQYNKSRLALHKIPWTEQQIMDYGGHPLIDVIHWQLPAG